MLMDAVISHQSPVDPTVISGTTLEDPITNHNGLGNPMDSQVDSAPESDESQPRTLNDAIITSAPTNGDPVNGVHPPPPSQQNGSSKQAAALKHIQPRKSAIPRLLPSALPRLQTQISAPAWNYSAQNSTASSPRSESQPKAFSCATSPEDPAVTDRSRVTSRPYTAVRTDRSTSEHPQRLADGESDTSSVFSGGSAPKRITSKVNSLKNVQHKPGGGNVKIVDQKIKIGPITSKCNSLANVKHKPGGGNVQIVDTKIDTSSVQPKVQSLQNVKHTPAGGQVEIVSEKLEFDKKVTSRVGSMQNARHRPGGGDVKIYNETLPWLKYNKPNLPPEEKARINKHRTTSHGNMSNSVHSGSTGLTSNSGKAS